MLVLPDQSNTKLSVFCRCSAYVLNGIPGILEEQPLSKQDAVLVNKNKNIKCRDPHGVHHNVHGHVFILPCFASIMVIASASILWFTSSYPSRFFPRCPSNCTVAPMSMQSGWRMWKTDNLRHLAPRKDILDSFSIDVPVVQDTVVRYIYIIYIYICTMITCEV